MVYQVTVPPPQKKNQQNFLRLNQRTHEHVWQRLSHCFERPAAIAKGLTSIKMEMENFLFFFNRSWIHWGFKDPTYKNLTGWGWANLGQQVLELYLESKVFVYVRWYELFSFLWYEVFQAFGYTLYWWLLINLTINSYYVLKKHCSC